MREVWSPLIFFASNSSFRLIPSAPVGFPSRSAEGAVAAAWARLACASGKIRGPSHDGPRKQHVGPAVRYSCELRVPPDAWPPLRPASDANSRSCENDLFSAGTLRPPLLAISRCRSSSIDAKPRFEVELPFAMNCLLPSLRLGQPRSDSMVPAKAGFFGGKSISRRGKLI